MCEFFNILRARYSKLRKLAATHVAGGSVGAPVSHPTANIKFY
jgi:hypothetical protein